MKQPELFPESPVVVRGSHSSLPLTEAPDQRSRVPGVQLKRFDTIGGVLADHRMPDTARPVVRDEGSPFPVRLGNDAETIASVDATHFLEHDPDRPVRSYAVWGPSPVHVRAPSGGYRAESVPESLRGMPGDARPEITEHESSHVTMAQLASRGLHDLTVPLEYHDTDPAPASPSDLSPSALVSHDRKMSLHRQKDAHRRAGDLRQREGAIPGPWTEGETSGLPVTMRYGDKEMDVTHSSQFPSLHLKDQADNPNPAQSQAVQDIQGEVDTRDRLRHFKNELSKR